MSDPNINLGNVIPSSLARKIIYGAYVLSAVAVGAVATYFLSVQLPEPSYVVGAQGIIAYLAIPVGTLALANAPKSDTPAA